MTAKKNLDKDQDKLHENMQTQVDKKTCFIIMPIADVAGYDSGHFHRVYNHIIKPACEIAGFDPIRADDINSSNMIVIDILKKIVESDLAICDLSGRNPNVLYELGLRQAFNKKTVLIKDNKTENIFDVQGFRYAQYDSNLRIDNVKNEIIKFSSALTETYEATGDVNSIVQLLQIEPAKIDTKTELSPSDTVLFRALNELNEKFDNMLSPHDKYSNNFSISGTLKNARPSKRYALLDDFENLVPNIYADIEKPDFPEKYLGEMYYLSNEEFGILSNVIIKDNSYEFIYAGNNLRKLNYNDSKMEMLSRFPIDRKTFKSL